jgi:trans-2,3-dihydro-3-hydroxyanthranilate isomerase
MMKYRFIQTDVFTNEPFTGNALAVFPEAEGLTDEQMMKIAREMNLSETVFVLRPEEKQAAEPATEETAKPDGAIDKADKPEVLRRLRIFTPAREIPFAGHPVVGTWNVLAREGVVLLPENGTGCTRINQEVGIGILPVEIEFKDGLPVQVVMTQGKPAMGAVMEDRGEQEDLARSLGLAIEDLDETLPIQIISTGLPFLAVPIRSLADLGRCRVNSSLLAEVYQRAGATGCSVVSRETIEIGAARAHTRMFAPGDNIAEDPATGSAGGALGAYLVHHGVQNVDPVDGRFSFVIEQGDFMHRPSRLNITVKGRAGEVTEVRVGGPSVIVARGEVFV